MLTYDFRLPPGPRTVEYALLAENLGFRAVWCPEVPAFGHDIWVTLARIAENTAPQIWSLSAHPELSPCDGAGLGHCNSRADRAGTVDGRVRHRAYRPGAD